MNSPIGSVVPAEPITEQLSLEGTFVDASGSVPLTKQSHLDHPRLCLVKF